MKRLPFGNSAVAPRPAPECTPQRDRRARATLERALGALSLPDPGVRETISRYEAHNDRSLFKSLHELQRQQAARRGDAVTAPVVVDVTGVSDGDQ